MYTGFTRHAIGLAILLTTALNVSAAYACPAVEGEASITTYPVTSSIIRSYSVVISTVDQIDNSSIDSITCRSQARHYCLRESNINPVRTVRDILFGGKYNQSNDICLHSTAIFSSGNYYRFWRQPIYVYVAEHDTQ